MTSDRLRAECRAALALCAIFAVLAAAAAHHRVIGGYRVESDFYASYAPDAARILEGAMPAPGKNPPGYAVLLAAVHPLTGDHFTSGKWLAVVTAAFTGWIAFSLFRLLFGGPSALLGCAVVLASAPFAEYAIQASTDMPFLLAAAAAMRVVLDERLPPARRAWLGGLLAGVACLVRLNGIFLVPPAAVAVAWLQDGAPSIRQRVMPAVLLLAAGLATVAPWLVLEGLHHGVTPGSGLHRDAAKAYYGRGARARGIDSFRDLVTRDPGSFAASYARKLVSNAVRSLTSDLIRPAASLFAVAGLVLAVRERHRAVLAMLLSMATLLGLMALTVWRPRFYLWLGMGYAGLAGWAGLRLADWLGALWPAPPRRSALVAVLALALVAPPAAWSVVSVRTLLRHEPREVLPAAAFLRRRADAAAGVTSYKPHVPYLAGVPWKRFGEIRTLREMETVVRRHGVHYVVYEHAAQGSLPVLRRLRHPGQAPAWLRPVYRARSGRLVIYEVADRRLR